MVKKIKVSLLKDSTSTNSKEAIDLHNKSRFGELVSGKIQYSLLETLYLLEKEKIEVLENKKKITFSKLLEKIKKQDPEFLVKFKVFSDMRNRGYIIKTALKFGADFRVYEKGIKPGQDHAKWLLFPVHGNSKLTWYDLSAKTRVAHSTKKKLLIAIVDDEGDVTYYEIGWLKP
jgi:tRNA-intron endonuclease, archaea type